MTFADTFKPIALTLLIAIGAMANCRSASAAETELLTVAGGCFWCVEADFEKVPGVVEVVSGFTGGTVKNPTYKQVTRGGTGHFEAVQIEFQPSVVSRESLLNKFLRSIDPTDAGGQFCNRGQSYATAIFTSDQDEAAIAERVKARAQSELGQKIVTPILAETAFFPAEAYHQDYYKSKKLVVTRFGPKRRSEAYKLYRNACGRDKRVKQLWGSAAPFAGG
jgi:peptide-methionine (S)-S-oxide reductase